MKKTDYRDYSVDDLSRDDYFRAWVIDHNHQSELFWLNWLEQNPDCADKVQLARAFLQALGEKDTALPASELDQIMNNILQSNPARVVPFWQRTAFQLAASLLLMLGIGYFSIAYLQRSDDSIDGLQADSANLTNSDFVETVNTGAQLQTIRLQDNSQVQLYPKSKLRYPKQFDPNRREVYLKGRAFFAITKNPRKPFWVYTDQISTQVLGTSFLVTTTSSNAKVEVHSGRVSVYRRNDVSREQQTSKSESAGMVLTPNQQVVFSNTDKRLVKSVVDRPINLLKTPEIEYIFDEAPITQVLKLLEKTYGLTFIYDEASLSECYLTANLTNESLFDKLNLICKITRSSYELVDGQIVIHSKGCDNK